MERRKFILGLLLRLAIFAALAGYIWWGNSAVMVTEIAVTAPGLPEEFSGYRIAQLSDLHNGEFGEGNARLLRLLEECRPDVIVLTGDLIDSRRTDVSISADLAAKAARLAPTYYVTGNHEARVLDDYEQLKTAMEAAGVRVLENELTTLERNGAEVCLIGLHDSSFTSVQDQLTALAPQAEGYTILLSHRPELVGYYAGAGMDLVFSGHAHGGQFRFPVLGGLIAPGQGVFPEYDAGLYQVQSTQLIVSRGLGNSSFPFRLNNRPEIVLTILK